MFHNSISYKVIDFLNASEKILQAPIIDSDIVDFSSDDVAFLVVDNNKNRTDISVRFFNFICFELFARISAGI